MFKKSKCAAFNLAEVAMHGEVEVGVVVVYCDEQAFHGDLCCQLLAYFSLQSNFGRFARLHLSARKLPPVFPFAITTLCGKYALAVADYGGNHFYMFSFFCVRNYPIALY